MSADDTVTITVELTAREARALASTAALWAGILEDAHPAAEPPEGCQVFPLVSAAMRLETAMLLAGVGE